MTVTLQAPGQKDFVELICDVAGYSLMQAVRGTLNQPTFVGKVFPFAVDVALYNMLLRPLIEQTNLLSIAGAADTDPRRSSPGLRTLSEIVVLTTMINISKQVGFATKSGTIMDDAQDVFGALGVSHVLLKIKDELGFPIPTKL